MEGVTERGIAFILKIKGNNNAATFYRHQPFFQLGRNLARFLPVIAGARFVESLFEIKGIMPRSEQDDSRPILFRESAELPGLITVLGAKIDSVYDVEAELSRVA